MRLLGPISGQLERLCFFECLCDLTIGIDEWPGASLVVYLRGDLKFQRRRRQLNISLPELIIMIYSYKRIIPICICSMFYSGSASAITECGTHVIQNWTGAAGEVLVVFDSAPPVYIFQDTTGTGAQKNALANVLSALVSGKSVTIRYAADGVACTVGQASRTDFAGIWLNR